MSRLIGLRAFIAGLAGIATLHFARDEILSRLNDGSYSLVYTGQASLIAALISLVGLYIYLSPKRR